MLLWFVLSPFCFLFLTHLPLIPCSKTMGDQNLSWVLTEHKMKTQPFPCILSCHLFCYLHVINNSKHYSFCCYGFIFIYCFPIAAEQLTACYEYTLNDLLWWLCQLLQIQEKKKTFWNSLGSFIIFFLQSVFAFLTHYLWNICIML